jgi:hypothetical protein
MMGSPLDDEIEAEVRRVRVIQRKQLIASLASLAVAATIIVGGEALIVLLLAGGGSGRVPIAIFAIPFAAGLPPAWLVRMALWPKDPVV